MDVAGVVALCKLSQRRNVDGEMCNMSKVQSSNCALGGDRPKQATLRCTDDVYNYMALQCPGNHGHQPYQVTKQANRWKFDAADESEYPWLMCVRIWQALQQYFDRISNLRLFRGRQ